ncbi:hypothetical protein BY996DRAFT_6562653 [Phakopsora pachyrhizi]|nr:hypothetical protein BY996DRAFT_6562653 [Phakopsora pachyrhizi]
MTSEIKIKNMLDTRFEQLSSSLPATITRKKVLIINDELPNTNWEPRPKKDLIDSQEIQKPSKISSKASDRVTKPSSNHPSNEMMTNLSNLILKIFNKSQNSNKSH